MTDLNTPTPPTVAPADAEPSHRLTRRGVLVLGGVGLATLGAGVYGVSRLGGIDSVLDLPGKGTQTPELRQQPPATSVDRDTLVRRTTVGAGAFVYEVTAKASAYHVATDFGRSLDAWAADYVALTGGRFDRVRSYGAWVGGSGRQWHGAGRAFDLAGLNLGDTVVASARYDTWRTESAASVARRQRAYWRLAATLHLHFADVLTYLYNGDHHNHIHVDTGRFGAGTPRFIRRSTVQVQSVQAMLTHVWGVRGLEASGEYDNATRDAADTVLVNVGFDGGLVDGTEAWGAFMRATARGA